MPATIERVGACAVTRTRNGAKGHLDWHDGQRRAWESRARFVFMLAGTQGGKTTFGPWWLAREIAERGSGDYLAVSSTVDLARLKMLPAIRECFEWLLGWGSWSKSERVLNLPDPDTGRNLENGEPWARIILRSAAADSGLESATAKAAWLDECGQDEFSVETWEAVLRRLSLSQGRVLGTTTPYNLGWIKSEVFDRWTDGDPNFEIVQFASTVNPAFPQAEYDRAKATMPDWRFRMFYRGELARPAGLIYDCYRDEIGAHLIEDFEIPSAWPRYVGVDFGAVNTATVWLAHDQEKDRYVLYRESLRGGLSTKEHVARTLQEAKEENVVAYWGGAGSEDQQRRDWSEEGCTIQKPLVSDVEGGISRVYGYFKSLRLFVFRSCKGVRDELGTYKRKLDDRGQPLEEIQDKRLFHRLDALRYVGSGLEGGDVTYGPRIW